MKTVTEQADKPAAASEEGNTGGDTSQSQNDEPVEESSVEETTTESATENVESSSEENQSSVWKVNFRKDGEAKILVEDKEITDSFDVEKNLFSDWN